MFSSAGAFINGKSVLVQTKSRAGYMYLVNSTYLSVHVNYKKLFQLEKSGKIPTLFMPDPLPYLTSQLAEVKNGANSAM